MKAIFSSIIEKRHKFESKKAKESSCRSKYFAILSFFCSLFMIAFCIVAILGLSLVIDNSSFFIKLNISQGIFSVILGIILIIVGVLCFVKLVIDNIVNIKYQFKMNKLKIRWFILCLFFISIILSILLFILNII